MSSRFSAIAVLSLVSLCPARENIRFDKAKLVLPEGGTQDADLLFQPDRQLLALECAYQGGFRIPYAQIVRLTQSLGERQVRPGAVVALGAPGVLMSKRAHYLSIEYEEAGSVRQLELRLPNGKWQQVLETAQAETGKPVADLARSSPAAAAALPSSPRNPDKADPAGESRPAATSYRFVNLSSETAAPGAAPYGKAAQTVEDKLVERLRQHGLGRAEAAGAACCKLVLKLLNADTRLMDMALVTQHWNAAIVATVSVEDAAGKSLYSKGYQAQSETPISWAAPALITGAAGKLADKIALDNDLLRALSGQAIAGDQPADAAEIVVTSVPDNAAIEVNGAASGNTPATLHLAPGEYRITVREENCAAWERTLKAGPGASIRLHAVLSPCRPESPEQSGKRVGNR